MNNNVEQNTTILATILADTFTLYVKTLNYHWHMKSNNFYETHLLSESQYTEMATAVDTLAEQIVIYGKKAPATMAEFLKITSIKEGAANNIEEMLKELASDNQAITEKISKAIDSVDFITQDLLTHRATIHSKNAWLLKSSLPK